jgi:hypothetical protein
MGNQSQSHFHVNLQNFLKGGPNPNIEMRLLETMSMLDSFYFLTEFTYDAILESYLKNPMNIAAILKFCIDTLHTMAQSDDNFGKNEDRKNSTKLTMSCVFMLIKLIAAILKD